MSRERAIYAIVSAVTRFQEEIADILNAKAIEAEKARSWIVGNVHSHEFEEHDEQMKHAMQMHEQIIELIDGLIKMETALGTHLKLLIGQEDAGGGMGGRNRHGGQGGHDGLGGGFGDLFGGGMGGN